MVGLLGKVGSLVDLWRRREGWSGGMDVVNVETERGVG